MGTSIKPKTYPSENPVTTVSNFMRYYQPISSVFVTQAITEYAKEIIENKDKMIAENQRSIIAPELWVDIAEDWIKLNNDKHGTKDS